MRLRLAIPLFTLFPIILMAGENPLGKPSPKGQYYVVYRCFDSGGLKDRQTGKFLECFSLLIPKDWKFEGGLRWIANEKPLNQITRTDLMKPVRGQWRVVSPDGHSAFVAYPEVCWIDMSHSPERQFGIVRPPGSDYEGMIVYPAIPAEQYITDFVIPRQRGQLADVKVVSKGAANDLAKQYTAEAQAINRALGGAAALTYRAGVVVVEHRENEAPPLEGVVSGSPPEGGVHMGKPPSGADT
jgi:hypothetical protein